MRTAPCVTVTVLMSTPLSSRTRQSIAAGRRLRALRKAKGLSARAAAAVLGITHPALLNYEDGKVPEEPYRKAIEERTKDWPGPAGQPGGPVLASEWGLTRRERTAEARLARSAA